MLKALSGEPGQRSGRRLPAILGGMGYMREAPIERLWRDARALAIGGGARPK